jgi:uncharacterized protein (DUF1810 family)
MADPYDLRRFVDAQAGVIERAIGELAAGRKTSHWMWFVFPQLKGLGRSPTALFFGLASLEEARAYLAHPLLGPRLQAATRAALTAPAGSLHALFGSPDDLKFVSSMTLFERAADDPAPFDAALERWAEGRRDPQTLALLGVNA